VNGSGNQTPFKMAGFADKLLISDKLAKLLNFINFFTTFFTYLYRPTFDINNNWTLIGWLNSQADWSAVETSQTSD